MTAGKSGKIPPGQLNGNGGSGGTSTSESFRYFYHPDHLGSTSYITDASGEVYQHLEYFAFGETFVEEHSNTDRTPYLFNGKELDEETGLGYYGARYYDAKTSMFQSVDRFAEKYTNLSPYSYGANNPIKYVDIHGDSIYVFGPDGKYITTLDDGKERIIGRYYKSSKETKDGKTMYTDFVEFEFNDIEVDREKIMSGEFKSSAGEQS